MLSCSVCGGTEFSHRTILWKELVSEWELAPHEEDYVNRQQGTACTACGANLRSIALADAIRTVVGTTLSLRKFVKTSEAARIALLEINEAGDLSRVLRRLPGRILAAYPAVDMRDLPYADASFDLVVHSDTLEHIPDPMRALEECRRVLRPGGVLCFTVPTVVGRLSRSRDGLPKSYHGSSETGSDDYRVQTEFGGDMWTYVLRAGFEAVSINAVEYPAALALSARKPLPAGAPLPAPPWTPGDRAEADASTVPDAPPFQVGSAAGNKPVVIHYHIYKNAGTSVDAMLEKSFGAKWSPFEGADANDVQSSTALGNFLRARPDIEAVSTHLGRPPLPWPECLPIVFLRHPILRAWSVYEFARQDVSQPYSEIAMQRSFADYVRWALDGEGNGLVIRNYQVAHLSDASYRLVDAYLNRADADDLRESCDLLAGWGIVGIVERFATSCALFQAAYGKRAPALNLEPLWLNRSNMKTIAFEHQLAEIQDQIGESLYTKLLEHNDLDMKLYQFGCKLQDKAL